MSWDKMTMTSAVIYGIVFVYCVLLALWSWPSGQCSHFTALASLINLGFLEETAVHVCLDMTILNHSCATRGTSALALIKVALGLDVDARIRCTTYVAHWSSVGASSKLLLCALLILLLRLIPWTGTPYGG